MEKALLNPIHMAFSGLLTDWGGGENGPLSLKSVTHVLQL